MKKSASNQLSLDTASILGQPPNMVSRSRLFWQCRRGSLELDTLLTRYLEQRYDFAPTTEQAAFSQLLSLEDQQIFQYLSGQSKPETVEITNLVTQISSLIPSSS
jgi:antitoxin CptB